MAEYNTNPYDMNPKATDIPYIAHGNQSSHVQSYNNGKEMEMNSMTGTLQQKAEISQDVIRKQDIIIVQDRSNPYEQKVKPPISAYPPNQNPPLPTQPQPSITRKKRSPIRTSLPVRYYPSNTYTYPYYYDSSGCYYCCWFNGNCFPCEACHQCFCSPILCDPFPCCNGCTGFHCGCLECLPPCQAIDCVKQNNCDCCQFLPCCSGCEFCSQACDGTCISALPCCNGCQCLELCQIIPCCNGCECEHLFGCMPCCNDAICNICGCLHGCDLCNCLDTCGNGGFECLGNCECGNCDCNGCDCNGCDCNGCDLGGCDLGGCDLGNCDC